MTKDQIRALALASGFKLKQQINGGMDLNPYVYEFANTLLMHQPTLEKDCMNSYQLPEQPVIPPVEKPLKTYDIKWQRDASADYQIEDIVSTTEKCEGQVKGTCFTDATNNFLKHVPDGEITFIQLVEDSEND